MKKLMLICGICMLMYSCKDRVQEFIPGTYVTRDSGEYSIAWDTLIISRVYQKEYQVLRRSSWQKIRSGKLKPVEHDTDSWTAIYNPQTRLLMETAKGKILRFDPARGALKVEQREYLKIKN